MLIWLVGGRKVLEMWNFAQEKPRQLCTVKLHRLHSEILYNVSELQSVQTRLTQGFKARCPGMALEVYVFEYTDLCAWLTRVSFLLVKYKKD